MRNDMKWYCYVCGKPVHGNFYLWSLNDSTDRIFICCLNKTCMAQIDDKDLYCVKVRICKP